MPMDAFRDLTLPASYYAKSDATLIFHVAKAGSTSLLSMIAAANGIDPDELSAILPHPEIAWDQAVWSGAQDFLLRALSLPDRMAICNDPGIQRIAFVRHPVERLWSAWVSKIVVGEPSYASLRDELLGPFGQVRIDARTTRQELAGLFADFLGRLHQLNLLDSDLHFMPQATLLNGAPADTSFYESSALFEQLSQKVPSLTKLPLLQRRNETRTLVHGPILTLHTFRAVKDIYSRDFEAFGTQFDWSYERIWAIDSEGPKHPVSDCFRDRCRATRRFTNVVRQEAQVSRELASLQEACARLTQELGTLSAEHHAVTTSRIWRWTRAYRALRSSRTGNLVVE